MLQKTTALSSVTRFAALTVAAIFLFAMFATLSMKHSTQAAGWCEPTVSKAAQVLCPMNALEHLSWWSGTFAGTVNNNLGLGLATMLVSLLAVSFVVQIKASRPLPTSKSPPEVKTYGFLPRFLASGIIQPLLYA